MSVLFKGPGWTPGKPRLGDPADLPEVHVVRCTPDDTQYISMHVILSSVCRTFLMCFFLP